MSSYIEIRQFKDISIADQFFNNLKEDYKEFLEWYETKSEEQVYVQYNDETLTGFLYVKIEDGEVNDVIPPLPSARHVKIGTFKVDAHGTRLGEKLLKKAFDYAIVNQADDMYITVFSKYVGLIDMLEEFGFREWGEKHTPNGVETVFCKSLSQTDITGNIRQNYPLFDTRSNNFYLLAIRPEWHSQLFPDSLLNDESYDLLADVSHTNSISKSYICSMDVSALRPGDLLVIYRMGDDKGPAEYRAVATSVCTVEQNFKKSDFPTIDDFVRDTLSYSVFSEKDLRRWWDRNPLFIIKMLYNAAFTRRVIRKKLAEDIGLDRGARWGFLPLTKDQFLDILEAGGINERIIIH